MLDNHYKPEVHIGPWIAPGKQPDYNDCQNHDITTRHNEEQYTNAAESLKRSILKTFPVVKVYLKPVIFDPLSRTLENIYNRKRIDCQKSRKYRFSDRIANVKTLKDESDNLRNAKIYILQNDQGGHQTIEENYIAKPGQCELCLGPMIKFIDNEPKQMDNKSRFQNRPSSSARKGILKNENQSNFKKDEGQNKDEFVDEFPFNKIQQIKNKDLVLLKMPKDFNTFKLTGICGQQIISLEVISPSNDIITKSNKSLTIQNEVKQNKFGLSLKFNEEFSKGICQTKRFYELNNYTIQQITKDMLLFEFQELLNFLNASRPDIKKILELEDNRCKFIDDNSIQNDKDEDEEQFENFC
ncbi:hypothetical protein IMG5_017260 [Ichthyophthirius multifiliis]|uniref:Uncharacterized protein n=1 Tax=Ichthyophthirius multifiliis TaxID=5932 RepID=G0QKF7_ICHMU|nr:hypothetical protein IMG5_017260 [Ichthyophthirius multifiliis]EGR34298.1 hypothetical protein IMG5_017260 [Ichthyophthirius multifiliis]|eukprot:XP_004039602.1 hypothetical protein IMG5_017260 [Ichthyophthirius multifiliis]